VRQKNNYLNIAVVLISMTLIFFLNISKASCAETEPVKIEVRHADKIDYDANSHVVILIGSVHIVRGTMSVKCDRVNMTLTRDEKGIENAVAEGRVEILDGTRRGRADKAVFTEGSSEITMTGNPKLWNEGNEISADQIIYNLKTRSMQAEGKVRGFILPGSEF